LAILSTALSTYLPTPLLMFIHSPDASRDIPVFQGSDTLRSACDELLKIAFSDV
jgi:hypothetical protein